ncbi:MAG TPA: GxGYxYP domain-containing protein [Ktedonobacteraceae bacterium]
MSTIAEKEDTTLRITRPAAAWQEEALLPSLSQTSSVEIYDLRGASPDSVLSVSTLAGLINRGPARLYCLESSDDEFWLQELDPALPCTRASVTGDEILDQLLLKHREQVAGLVIYDPGLLDTRNVASTLAALRAGLVVSPEQASRFQTAPWHVPVLADLREHGWKSRVQAYVWAYKHLLAECSPDLIAGLDPKLCGVLRSYLVTQRVFTCWLDARGIIPRSSAGWHCERGLLKRLFASFHPGAFHLGWFVSEPFGIRLASRSALLTLASDHCTNLGVWSSLPCSPEQALADAPITLDERVSTNEQTVAREQDTVREQVNARRSIVERAGEQFDANATYLSFTISDGDNLQYCQHHLLRLWRDPARGALPLGWTLAPALWRIMPRLAAFYRRTASKNDELIAGPSGAAYMLPSHWPREHRQAFLQLTADLLRVMGAASLQILDSGTWFSMRFLTPDLQELFADQLSAHGLRGILSGAGGFRPSWRRRAGLLVYQNLGLALNPRRTLSLIRSALARGTRFINVYIFAWNITPGDLQRIVQQLDGKVRVVTPARLLELIELAEKEKK